MSKVKCSITLDEELVTKIEDKSGANLSKWLNSAGWFYFKKDERFKFFANPLARNLFFKALDELSTYEGNLDIARKYSRDLWQLYEVNFTPRELIELIGGSNATVVRRAIGLDGSVKDLSFPVKLRHNAKL